MQSAISKRLRKISEILRIENKMIDSQEEEYEISTQEDEEAILVEHGLHLADFRTKRAFQLEEEPLTGAFLDHRRRLANLVKPGNLLVIDESILASNAKLAKREGKMRYIQLL